MPTKYAGQGTLPVNTLGYQFRRAIASTTNTTPIVVSSSNHGCLTGDTVEIENHLTNTAANGLWQIIKIDSNNFSLDGSSGVAAGTATGYLTDYEIQPAYVLPTGGDLVDPGVIGTAMEGLANTDPYLYRLTGRYRCVETGEFLSFNTDPSHNFATENLGNSWAACVDFTNIIANLDGPGYGVPHIQLNDMVKVTLTLSVQIQGATAASDTVGVALGSGSGNNLGVPIATTFSPGNSNVATWTIDTPFGAGPYNSDYKQLTLSDTWYFTDPVTVPLPLTTPRTFDVTLWAKSNRASGIQMLAFGSYKLTWELWRPN